MFLELGTHKLRYHRKVQKTRCGLFMCDRLICLEQTKFDNVFRA